MKKTISVFVILFIAIIPSIFSSNLKPGDVFPPFTAHALNDSMTTVPNNVTPSVTLISLAFSRKDTAVTEAWTDTFTARYKTTPGVSYIQTAVIPEMAFISGVIANALRGAIAKERWGNFLIYSGNGDAFAKTFSVVDPGLFYIYLTGKDGRIIKIIKTPALTKKYMDEIFVLIDKEIKQVYNDNQQDAQKITGGFK
jgi:hypothetical protein